MTFGNDSNFVRVCFSLAARKMDNIFGYFDRNQFYKKQQTFCARTYSMLLILGECRSNVLFGFSTKFFVFNAQSDNCLLKIFPLTSVRND